MISQEKWMILTPLQKLPKNVEDSDKLIVAKGLKKLPKVKKIAQSGHTAYLLHWRLISRFLPRVHSHGACSVLRGVIRGRLDRFGIKRFLNKRPFNSAVVWMLLKAKNLKSYWADPIRKNFRIKLCWARFEHSDWL